MDKINNNDLKLLIKMAYDEIDRLAIDGDDYGEIESLKDRLEAIYKDRGLDINKDLKR